MASCEWCVSGKATCAGKTKMGIGLLSRMCDSCKERLCRKDGLGNYLSMPMEEVEAKYPKGFYQ